MTCDKRLYYKPVVRLEKTAVRNSVKINADDNDEEEEEDGDILTIIKSVCFSGGIYHTDGSLDQSLCLLMACLQSMLLPRWRAACKFLLKKKSNKL